MIQIGWWGRHGPGYPWRFDREEDPARVWCAPRAEWVAAYIKETDDH